MFSSFVMPKRDGQLSPHVASLVHRGNYQAPLINPAVSFRAAYLADLMLSRTFK
jgi:hypothetical protein